MSDDHNYFEFHDEESECPTEFWEETVLTFATASECATASASVTTATSRPTRTLAKKANCSSLICDFFSVLTQIQMNTLLSFLWDWWILNDIEIALRNVHFRYRGSIEYRDTRDGIVIVAPFSDIAQHYNRLAHKFRHRHRPHSVYCKQEAKHHNKKASQR